MRTPNASIEWPIPLEVLQRSHDRVPVLEAELAVAKETNKNLRAELREAKEVLYRATHIRRHRFLDSESGLTAEVSP
jgi:hypothetical protein